MSANYQEQLSALLDGELSSDETRFLLRRVDADQDLARTWSNYQLASDVLKKRFATPMRADFAASVMQAIAAEKQSVSRGGLLRWAGGGAIAAAVAVFALTTTRTVDEPQPGQAVIASIPAASASNQTSDRVESKLRLPGFPALDYTQSASFENGGTSQTSLPSYVRARNEAAERFNDFGPYVLMTAPKAAPVEQLPAATQH